MLLNSSPKFMYQGLYIIPTHFRPKFEQKYPKSSLGQIFCQLQLMLKKPRLS
jgi:hypothetical protein